jgi:hypothetical protein
VQIHDDHFSQTEKDTVWLKVVGKKKWIVLSKDPHIRKRDLERQRLRESRVHAFFLGRADLKGPEQAEIFRRAIPKIIALVEAATRPVIGLIRRDASLDILDEDLELQQTRRQKRAGKRQRRR